MADHASLLTELHRCAFLLAGSRGSASTLVDATIESATRAGYGVALPALVGVMARAVAREQKSRHSFDDLDDLLRARPDDLPRDPPGDAVVWEVKRACLARVLGCLTGPLRVSFVLTDVLGFEPPQASALLEIQESAYRVRLTRARGYVDGFLAPRCQHVAVNPCSCRDVAPAWLELGVIEAPPGHDTPESPYDRDPPVEASLLYRRLLAPLLPCEQADRLVARLPAARSKAT